MGVRKVYLLNCSTQMRGSSTYITKNNEYIIDQKEDKLNLKRVHYSFF